MGQNIGGGSSSNEEPKVRTELLHKKIVLEDVVIVERKKEIEVPDVKYKEVVYEKPIINETVIDTVKYNVREEDTTKYKTKEVETIKYIPRDVMLERPVVHDAVYEKPVIVTKEYEKPVIREREIEVVSVKNVDEINAYVSAVKSLSIALADLENHLQTLRRYTLVEEVIKVPKIEYFTTKAERIVWTDVKRDRETGVIKDADRIQSDK